jgi:hypothetical protein
MVGFYRTGMAKSKSRPWLDFIEPEWQNQNRDPKSEDLGHPAVEPPEWFV